MVTFFGSNTVNEMELVRLKKILEDVFEVCKKGHYGLAMRKVTLGLFPMIWEKIEEKLKTPS